MIEEGCPILVYDDGEDNDEKKSYSPALKRAKQKLSRTETEEISDRTGLDYIEESSRFEIVSFGEPYYVHHPSGEVDASHSSLPLNRGMEIIFLHFLLEGNDCPPSGRWMKMKELPDGAPYDGPFHRQAVKPLVRQMGEDPDALKEAAARLEGEFIDEADIGFKLYPLPDVPLIYLLWRGDEEIEGGANLLFDSSVIIKLHTEDAAVLGEYATDLLIRFCEETKNS